MVANPALLGQCGYRNPTKPYQDTTNSLEKADLKEGCGGEDSGFVDQWKEVILHEAGEEEDKQGCWQTKVIGAGKAELARGKIEPVIKMKNVGEEGDVLRKTLKERTEI